LFGKSGIKYLWPMRHYREILQNKFSEEYKKLNEQQRNAVDTIEGPVMVIAASNFATAIIIEAGLSFLGIGVQAPQPSWGLMIKENYNFIITHNPMLAMVPGFAIMLLVLAFNLLGNGLRDAVDVRSRG